MSDQELGSAYWFLASPEDFEAWLAKKFIGSAVRTKGDEYLEDSFKDAFEIPIREYLSERSLSIGFSGEVELLIDEQSKLAVQVNFVSVDE